MGKENSLTRKAIVVATIVKAFQPIFKKTQNVNGHEYLSVLILENYILGKMK